jgi:hypothetical protein
MEHVVRGDPNKRHAGDLGISEKTVKAHRHRVMEKMEAGSLAELVRLADAASPPAAAKHRLRSRRPGAASAGSRRSR